MLPDLIFHVEVKKLPRGFFNFYGWVTIGQVNSGDNGIVEVSLNGLNGWKLTCNLIECNLVYHAEIQGHPIEGFTSIRLSIQFQWLCVQFGKRCGVLFLQIFVSLCFAPLFFNLVTKN